MPIGAIVLSKNYELTYKVCAIEFGFAEKVKTKHTAFCINTCFRLTTTDLEKIYLSDMFPWNNWYGTARSLRLIPYLDGIISILLQF